MDATIAAETARQQWDAARAKAIAWAVEVAGDARVVYLDTETTGFGPRAEIVDIAVVSSAGQILLESLVRPRRRIPDDVIAVHGITNADVAGAPAWCDIYAEVRRVLEGRRIVVYNVVFDQQMVTQECGQYALAVPVADWDCAMKKYAGFYGSWDARKRWYKFQKLEHAVIAFGAEPGGHRAAADAFACRHVVLGMAATPPPARQTEWTTPDPPWASYRVAPSPADRGPAVAPQTPAGRSRDLAQWAGAARAFRELLDELPADLRERPGACGIWSPREVVAHCAGWEWEAARRLRLIAADPARPDAVYNLDSFNAASVAVRAEQTWQAALDELAKASKTLATAAAAMPENRHTREWLIGRAADFAEHTAGLRRWRDEVLASSRRRSWSRDRSPRGENSA